MVVQICVGSSCHLKGSHDIVELLQDAVKEHNLENEITLAGSFCAGKCNRIGVTVTVDDDIYPGITRENFREFFDFLYPKNIKDTFGSGLFECKNMLIRKKFLSQAMKFFSTHGVFPQKNSRISFLSDTAEHDFNFISCQYVA
mgnify:CR=1 FL=1